MILLHYMFIGGFIASLEAFIISNIKDKEATIEEERNRSKKKKKKKGENNNEKSTNKNN